MLRTNAVYCSWVLHNTLLLGADLVLQRACPCWTSATALPWWYCPQHLAHLASLKCSSVLEQLVEISRQASGSDNRE